jgi:hypothetical protein
MSDHALAELLERAREADSVELRLTLPELEHRRALALLGTDPLAAQVRQVYFFDTPDLALERSGIVVRARGIPQCAHDSDVMLRPAVPDELTAELRRSPSFVVEVDAMPGGHVCSVAMRSTLGRRDVREFVNRRRPLRKLLSKEQRDFLSDHAPAGVELDDLAVLGPILVLELEFFPPGSGRRLAAAVWLYPDGSRALEISTRCTPDEAFQVAAETRAFLADRGIEATGEQRARTREALEFLSGRVHQ